ncbi:MAG: branched-chain amino acid transaminase [Candidatus Dadabacteria bacterium]|nr:MAG: branched-chain amino acid transaminase [Candidatus Dadabacteria bacterium]
MEPTEKIWFNGKFVNWQDATVHSLTHSLHYGGGVFEGIRFYNTERGPAVFRLRDHIKRLAYSAEALQVEIPYSIDDLCRATTELIAVNQISEGYIRPLVFFGYGRLGLNPQDLPVETLIACWAWGRYLPYEMVDVKVSKYRRISPDTTVADAKICGNYVNSILAVLEVRGTSYHEALFLDASGNIAEGPGENFFIVENRTVVTPPEGAILPGITRDTVMELARGEGLKVMEEKIPVERAQAADECFFTGTAAEVVPIRSIDDKTIGDGKPGEITRMLQVEYKKLVTGKLDSESNYLSYVKK